MKGSGGEGDECAVLASMSRYAAVPPVGYDLDAHLDRKFGKRKAVGLSLRDGFCVQSSLRTDIPYLLHSIDVVDGAGEHVAHISVSRSGRVKVLPGCSCRPSEEEAVAAWMVVRRPRPGRG